jgi:hypothetical protein
VDNLSQKSPKCCAQQLPRQFGGCVVPFRGSYTAFGTRCVCTAHGIRSLALPTWAWPVGRDPHPIVVVEVEGILWLVMIGLDSIMETAFPPENSAIYLTNLRFQRLGTLEELGL